MSGGTNGALDVRLMRTLLILLTERSVSRTAEILGQSQPAVSLTLKRLRGLIGDPLLVRTGSALVPTERGLALKETVRRLIDEMDATLSPSPRFDPAVSNRCFRIAAANCLGAILIPRIVREIGRHAPAATVDLCPMPRIEDFAALLARGEVDLVIGNWPRPPADLRIAPLLSTDIVCMVGPRHPLAQQATPLSLDLYLRQRHISPTPVQSAALSPIDGRLLELGLSRRIAATTPEYALVPPIIIESDLMFTTGRPFAEHYAQMFPFAVLDAPAELSGMDFYMLWHECKHASPSHAWLRRVLRGVAADCRRIDCRTAGPRAAPSAYSALTAGGPSHAGA